ncbi:MAG: hypothetical protein ABSH08_08880 [Tepidisphaeraceae bacterium]|jgi:hypothetical protein
MDKRSHLAGILSAIFAIAATASFPRGAAAQNPASPASPSRATPSQTNPIALPWIHEGLRITSTWEVWLMPGSQWQFTQDPDGNWVDQNGNRFSRDRRPEGTSASGLSVSVISCIDGDHALLSNQGFAFRPAAGYAAPVPLAGYAAQSVSTIDEDERWKPPAKLAAMQSDPANGLLVRRIQWRNANAAYDAVRLDWQGNDVYKCQIYDLHTGGLLHFATVSHGGPPPQSALGAGNPEDTTLTQGDFVEARDISVPWAHEPMPDSITSIRSLHYQGVQRMIGAPSGTPLRIDIDMGKHGAGWYKVGIASAIQTPGLAPPPSHSETEFGRYSFVGLWIPPSALDGMKQGDVFDTDKPTQMKTYVLRSDEDSVVIEAANSSGGSDDRYDKRTGILTAQRIFTNPAGAAPGMETVVQLAGQQ